MTDLVFREASVVRDGRVEVLDVAVHRGVIEQVAPRVGEAGQQEFDCRGRLLLPGAIDLHVHFRDPGLTHKEDLESGTAAAVSAGVTTICDMPNCRPPATTAERVREKAARARAVARCNVLLWMALDGDNADEIERAWGLDGLVGVKVFLGATTGDMVSGDAALERALDRVDLPFAFHAELESVLAAARASAGPDPTAADHHLLRPPEAVVQGARRIASLARPGRSLHLAHVSTPAELDVLAGAPGVTCEVAPHHLWFTHQDTARLGNLLKMNPPVRDPADRDGLRAALADGRIDAAATDHAPHTLDEKALPYPQAPSGVPGVETLVPSILRLVQQGLLTLPRAVEVLCEAPARIARLPRKGRVAPGFDADLCLWDPASTWTVARADLRTRCGWSPFEGETLAGRPEAVWIAGRRRA